MGLCLIAELATLLWWTDVILKVAIGLGAVIFVHELGHFLVAKACGVRCDKFMIGFDIGGWKLSHKWGETEYGIGILPLGGYVKMLGQDDDPAHIAEQMQKSQVAPANPNAVEIYGPNGEKYFVDRRSYLAKSVPQRMAIISAGVVMNIIFAFIFAVIAYGMGVTYMPCIVSETMPGSPAWRAGIEPGDEIVQIGNRVNPTFTQLRGGVTLGDLENGIPCVVRRASDGKEVEMVLTPEQGRGLATIGIVSPRSMVLSKIQPTTPESPAAEATLVEPAEGIPAEQAHLLGGDRVVRINDATVNDYREFAAQLAHNPETPLQVTVERTETPSADGATAKADVQTLTFEVGTRPERRFGLVMEMGPIVAIQAGSPAAAAGLKSGDLITAVDGKAMNGLDGPGSLWDPDAWDSVTLNDYLRRAAVAGREVEVTVQRTAQDEQRAESVTIAVQPRVPNDFLSVLPAGSPMSASTIGIAYRIENRVAALLPDSPAADAGMKPGDRVTTVKILLPRDSSGTDRDPIVVDFVPQQPGGLARFFGGLFGGESAEKPAVDELNWPMLFDAAQQTPAGTQFEFLFERDEKAANLTMALATGEGFFVPERGFNFSPIELTMRAGSFGEQVRLGWEETADALTMVYRFLQKIGTQVPVTALGGPVTIAKAAGYSASEGVSQLLIFLTMLSANLAVINFLPIPLLDGGHMVFLAWEGIRGRPASEKFVLALHTVGFVFIISLMLFVIALDVGLIPRGL